jgi:hypothetical protein
MSSTSQPTLSPLSPDAEDAWLYAGVAMAAFVLLLVLYRLILGKFVRFACNVIYALCLLAAAVMVLVCVAMYTKYKEEVSRIQMLMGDII